LQTLVGIKNEVFFKFRFSKFLLIPSLKREKDQQVRIRRCMHEAYSRNRARKKAERKVADALSEKQNRLACQESLPAPFRRF